MTMTFDGNGTITGLAAGGLPNGTVQPADLSTGAPTWDTSSNVGIGSSASANQRLKIKQSADTGAASFSTKIEANANDTGLFFGYRGVSAATAADTCAISASYESTGAYKPITFLTSDAERMRIDASGNLLVGKTSGSYKFEVRGGDNNSARIDNDGSTSTGLYFSNNGTNKALLYWQNSLNRFYVESGGSGGVYLASAGTSWTAASDERLKTDLVPISNATQKVSTLRAVTGRYKTDDEGVRRSFLIAQDVQAVLPEAVNATNPDELGVQYTDTIPLLVAAIKEQQQLLQELNAKVDAQAAEIAALKGQA